MQTALRLLMVLTTLALVACGTPLPVKDQPTLQCEATVPQVDDKQRPRIGADKQILTEKKMLPCDDPIGDVGTIDKIHTLYKGYYRTYINEAQAKRLQAQEASEWGFYGSILGVVGGIASSTATAITGGTIAAGSALHNDRYKLKIQATNYELAADAMLCMFVATADMEDQNLRNSQRIMLNAPIDRAVRNLALDGLLRVKDKLYKLQASFDLGTPDVNLLKNGSTTPATPKDGTVNSLTASESSAVNSAQNLKATLDGCYAPMAK